MNPKKWTSCIIAFVLIAGMLGLPGSKTNVASADNATFTHPGILQTATDIQNMRSQVAAQSEPWYSTYTYLKDTVTSYGTISANDYTLTNLKRSNSGSYNEMRLAANKVYNLALMYTVTGNNTYAEGARTIMLKYASIFKGVGTNGDSNSVYDTNLDVGVVALKFTAAAELLRYDYAGWSSADTNALIAMFHKNESGTAVSMYQLLANDAVLASYDMDNITHGHAAILRLGSMAYAIFAEDADLLEVVKSDFTANSTAYFTNQNAAAWQKKPDKSLGANGYSLLYNYNSSTGQSKESDRDQQHAMVNLSSFITVAHMAWNQGDNSLYEFNNRTLLKAVDFSARYNLGYDVAAYTSAYPWNHHGNQGITTFDRGRVTESTFSLAYNYYKFSSSAATSEYAYLTEMINHPLYAIDRNSFDVPGFSALTASPAARALDYTSNVAALNHTVHWQYSGVTRMVNGVPALWRVCDWTRERYCTRWQQCSNERHQCDCRFAVHVFKCSYKSKPALCQHWIGND
ncbi:alginate lyase family protein [Paenibacillus sp. NPDC057886]|uniref:alginate lyase family protein n=1 Tax=Paenibacillus sp. NPDC057886 TaxID=3346270 RepID=UPI00367E374E